MTFDSSHVFCGKTKLLPLVDQLRKANNTNYVISFFPRLILWGWPHVKIIATPLFCVKQAALPRIDVHYFSLVV